MNTRPRLRRRNTGKPARVIIFPESDLELGRVVLEMVRGQKIERVVATQDELRRFEIKALELENGVEIAVAGGSFMVLGSALK